MDAEKAARVAEALGCHYVKLNRFDEHLMTCGVVDVTVSPFLLERIAALLDERDALRERNELLERVKVLHEQCGKDIDALRAELAAANVGLIEALPHQGPSRSNIPRWLGEEALDVYHSKHFRGEKREVAWKNIFTRGGFSDSELDLFVPDWKEKLDVVTQLSAELAAVQETLATVEGIYAKVYWHITGGVISKVNTDPAAIIETFEECQRKEYEAELNAAKAEIERLVNGSEEVWRATHPSIGVAEGRGATYHTSYNSALSISARASVIQRGLFVPLEGE